MSATALLIASASFFWTGLVAHKLQEARRQTYVQQCRDVNGRHDVTRALYLRQLRDMPPGPERRRAEDAKNGTLLFIDAFLPRRDCNVYADRLVDGP